MRATKRCSPKEQRVSIYCFHGPITTEDQQDFRWAHWKGRSIEQLFRGVELVLRAYLFSKRRSNRCGSVMSWRCFQRAYQATILSTCLIYGPCSHILYWRLRRWVGFVCRHQGTRKDIPDLFMGISCCADSFDGSDVKTVKVKFLTSNVCWENSR
ncbi:hypothetical protein BKA63DRAFT_198359 [Paraphoma chrysanthemicola]|nr:hypothetical protein BKA63DRAFT_198359 [Paraphoma chrysanthemicola]